MLHGVLHGWDTGVPGVVGGTRDVPGRSRNHMLSKGSEAELSKVVKSGQEYLSYDLSYDLLMVPS